MFKNIRDGLGLNAGGLGYRRLAENADVIIYQRAAATTPGTQ